MKAANSHRWSFFRSGGFDQVRLDNPEDLANLRNLDQKLWTALACPATGLEFDARTLAYLDQDSDGRIRAPELLDAVDWALLRLQAPSVLFEGDGLPLSAFADNDEGRTLLAAARRLLANLDKPDATVLTVADTEDMAKVFPPNKPNGDGIVPAAMIEDAAMQAVVADIITALGADADRSNEPGITEEKITEFFVQAGALLAWQARATTNEVQLPLGDATADAAAALNAVRHKVDDFFNRVRMAAFDPRAGAFMNGEEAELVRLAALDLSGTEEAEGLPLANVAPGRALPLQDGINPAWMAAMAAFRSQVVMPLLGEKQLLSAEEWQLISEKFASYQSWLTERPVQAIDVLDAGRIAALVADDVKDKLLALVAFDMSVAAEAEGLLDVDRIVRFQKNLVPLLNNFISFRDFYTRQAKAIFQAGTLYIDGKSCDLTVRVSDMAKHSAQAASSGSYLVYCDCTRPGEAKKMTVVAAVTAGDAGNLAVGRNGIFYDREGVDWDAHVVKLIEHPISVREAFWTPYRRVSKMISDQMQKMAASRDKAMEDKAAAGVGDAATKVESATPAVAGAPATPPAPFDIAKFAGIFAAIGLAVGAIGTMLAAVAGGFLALKWWQMPLALVGAMLLVSGPSMMLAWFKLRRRNLGPLLDANGWAVNTAANITIAFGTALTQLAVLPEGAQRSLSDPYATKKHYWVWWLLLAAIVAGVVWGTRQGLIPALL
ncbi:MAG TPA: hypothetical protein PKY03_00055 [Moraxellaceae bacterium]|nr:hypothetical protein [Moraxellaceae bacterium]